MFSKTKRWKWAVSLLALVTLAGLVACTPAPGGVDEDVTVSTADGGGITVVGQGEAFGEPDEANVTLGVETFAKEVNDATANNEATIQAILAALTEQGIKGEDVQTSNYSLWAEQLYGDQGPEGIAGYRVTNQVNVKIRDIGRVGDVLTAATNAGANSIYGVSFTVADPAALEAQAREAAVADARARAESLAQLNGLTLGGVAGVSEVGQMPFPMIGGMGGGGGLVTEQAFATSISPGQLSYNVQVQVTFDIK